MLFSGTNFLLTPKTQNVGFVFGNISLSSDGVAEIGFSGEGETSTFLFSGKKIIDPDGNYVYSYEPNLPVSVSGDIKNGSYYRYHINGVPVGDGLTHPKSFSTEKFITKAVDCTFEADVKLFCPDIDYEVTFNSTFLAGDLLSGKIKNNSDIDFRIMGSYFSDSTNAEDLAGSVTGNVPAKSELDFSFQDVAVSYLDNSVNSILNLETTFGTITSPIKSTRISGSAENLFNFLTSKNTIPKITPYFSGSGNAKEFHWLPDSGSEQYSLFYESYDKDGNLKDKNLKVRLENVSPPTGETYTGTYVSSFFTYSTGHDYCVTGNECSDTQYTTRATCEAAGTCSEGGHTTQAACETAGKVWSPETWDDLIRDTWQCKGDYPGSGKYSQLPTIRFFNYSKITGVTFNSNNLFTKDTPEKIPILFSGYPGEAGDKASGYFLTEAFQMNLKNWAMEKYNTPLNDADHTNWKRITGVEITNQGTGYTKMPAIFAATGTGHLNTIEDDNVFDNQYWIDSVIGGTGYDMGKRMSPYVYGEFEAEAHGEYEAAYLTGIPYFIQVGSESTYYYSGILITNPGSGFEPLVYLPKVSVNRSSTDTFGNNPGDNASGEFLFNTGGSFYQFDKQWDVSTGSYIENVPIGFKENDLTYKSQYSGSTTLPSLEPSFFIGVHLNNLDIDEPLVSKLIIEGEENSISEYLITGKNTYSANTGLGFIKPIPLFDGENFYNITYFGS